jgi:hypothetical protein
MVKNSVMTHTTKNIFYAIIIIILFVLLFRRQYSVHIERVLLFSLLFCLLYVLTKDWIYSLLGAILLFLLFNMMMRQQYQMENFDNKKGNDFLQKMKEKMSDYEKNPDVQKASEGIQDLMKKLDGGIELKDSDMKETEKMDVPTEEYEDDKKSYPLQKAQKEMYELVGTIDTLKNSIETLAPVLSQGKELMNMFENFKL